MRRVVYRGARVFDGVALHDHAALVIEDRRVAAILPEDEASGGETVQLDGGVLSPGFVDLQVNGGGGVMFNDAPSVDGLRTIAAAHLAAGTAAFLPTLITDTLDATHAAIAAVEAAMAAGVPGIAGLHLEGPHLAVARKGAHDGALIRPMTEADADMLEAVARRLPLLKLTVAPESVRPDQIARLTRAGALVSLGHSDCGHDEAVRAFDAGARCVTHLFNAMSPLHHREPGLVGAALGTGRVHAGLIADAIHVHPAAMRVACAAKRGQGRLFLVTDAMAPFGTAMQAFTLNGRRVLRRDGRLTLEDGTLAGADLTLPQAVGVMTAQVNLTLAEALAMATSGPAGLLPCHGLGHLRPGHACRLVHLDRAGRAVPLNDHDSD